MDRTFVAVISCAALLVGSCGSARPTESFSFAGARGPAAAAEALRTVAAERTKVDAVVRALGWEKADIWSAAFSGVGNDRTWNDPFITQAYRRDLPFTNGQRELIVLLTLDADGWKLDGPTITGDRDEIERAWDLAAYQTRTLRSAIGATAEKHDPDLAELKRMFERPMGRPR